jgi:competence protein ComEA
MEKEKFLAIIGQFKSEIILLFLSLLLIIFSLVFYTFISTSQEETPTEVPVQTSRSIEEISNWIYVDLEGAIVRPMVYRLKKGSRIYELLDKGGVSNEADKAYIAKNINKSEILVDQEKIYIPSMEEVISNTIPNLLTFVSTQEVDMPQKGNTNLVNINVATQTELEALPGVGATTATKIINNRPYNQIIDLLQNKIVGQSLYEKINSQLSVE